MVSQSITNILSTSPPWVVNCIWLSIISIACCFYKTVIGIALLSVFIINKIRLDQAPDAWITFILLIYLQYQQYTRQQIKDNKKVHVGSKSKPKHIATWSIVHEWLFTQLHMFVSPLSNQASEINAVVDLKNDVDLTKYAQKVAAGKVPTKKSNKKSKNKSSEDKKGSKAIEVRSRRIVRGELVYNYHYPVLETAINLSF